MPQHPWTDRPWDLDILIPQQRHAPEQTRCPHGRSVLVHCPACPDPVRTRPCSWRETVAVALLLVLTVVAIYLVGR